MGNPKPHFITSLLFSGRYNESICNSLFCEERQDTKK